MALDKQALQSLIYDFFFAFSRMEFALKQNGCLLDHTLGEKARPGWNDFVRKYQDRYQQTDEGRALVEARPKCQYVGQNDAMVWGDLMPRPRQSELRKSVDALNVVRNNLFHGGKHGEKAWDDPERTSLLLTLGLAVLKQLAELDESIRADFQNEYC